MSEHEATSRNAPPDQAITSAATAAPLSGPASGPISAPVSGPAAGPAAAATAGVLSAGLALGTGEVLSGLVARIPSLVTSVGDFVIDSAPGSVERWAISTLGTNDKPALVIGITVISLLIGAATGLAARHKFAKAWSVFVPFGIIGALAAGSDPQGSTILAWLAALASAAVGIGSLRLLLNFASRAGRQPVDSTDGSGQGRRTFVTAASAAAAVGVGLPLVGAALRGRRADQTEQERELVASALDSIGSDRQTDIPSAVGTTEAATSATTSAGLTAIDDNLDGIDGITPIVVPTEDFYRIDTALTVPQLDVDTWSMRITGMVENELEFTFDDLLAMDPIEEYVTLSCVSNQVGGNLVGNGLWLGVPLKRLLDQAGVLEGATQCVGRSVDGWTGGFPTAILDDPDRVAMVALAQNGEPLPVEHGFPARLVVAGLYGYVSATKWLKEIELTTLEGFDGYWIPRGWSKLGPVKTQSRIDVPGDRSGLAGGMNAIAGVAWAPDRGVEAVEVQVVDRASSQPELAPWIQAELSADVTDNAWRQWLVEWDASPGDYVIRVRATDGSGETQIEQRSRVDPDGATGWHTIAVSVR